MPNVDDEDGFRQAPWDEPILHQHAGMEMVRAGIHPQISDPGTRDLTIEAHCFGQLLWWGIWWGHTTLGSPTPTSWKPMKQEPLMYVPNRGGGSCSLFYRHKMVSLTPRVHIICWAPTSDPQVYKIRGLTTNLAKLWPYKSWCLWNWELLTPNLGVIFWKTEPFTTNKMRTCISNSFKWSKVSICLKLWRI